MFGFLQQMKTDIICQCSGKNDKKDAKQGGMLTRQKLAKKGLTDGWMFAIIINVVATTATQTAEATATILENDTEIKVIQY